MRMLLVSRGPYYMSYSSWNHSPSSDQYFLTHTHQMRRGDTYHPCHSQFIWWPWPQMHICDSSQSLLPKFSCKICSVYDDSHVEKTRQAVKNYAIIFTKLWQRLSYFSLQKMSGIVPMYHMRVRLNDLSLGVNYQSGTIFIFQWQL